MYYFVCFLLDVAIPRANTCLALGLGGPMFASRLTRLIANGVRVSRRNVLCLLVGADGNVFIMSGTRFRWRLHA